MQSLLIQGYEPLSKQTNYNENVYIKRFHQRLLQLYAKSANFTVCDPDVSQQQYLDNVQVISTNLHEPGRNPSHISSGSMKDVRNVKLG